MLLELPRFEGAKHASGHNLGLDIAKSVFQVPAEAICEPVNIAGNLTWRGARGRAGGARFGGRHFCCRLKA